MIARCDGKPIVWPEPTHGPADSEEVKAGLLKPYVGAYTQLDFLFLARAYLIRQRKSKGNMEYALYVHWRRKQWIESQED